MELLDFFSEYLLYHGSYADLIASVGALVLLLGIISCIFSFIFGGISSFWGK